jgi:transcriptional regulator with XRE-family HTH domain
MPPTGWFGSWEMMDAERKPFAVQFGKNLRRCRAGAGISQEELGFRASLHRTEIGLLERGRREPRLGTIVRLASALRVSFNMLLDGIDWKVNPPSSR